MEVSELEPNLKRASTMSHTKKYSLVALVFCWLVGTSAAFKSVDLRGPKAFQNAIGGVVLGLVGTGILALFIVLPAFVVGRAKDRSVQKKRLLASEASAFERIGTNGFTELMYLAGQGDVEKAKSLLDTGLNVNAQDEMGGTALLYAAMNAQQDMVSLLVAYGADPSIAAKNGLTARRAAENHRKKGIALDV
jgi:hypothetical protein